MFVLGMSICADAGEFRTAKARTAEAASVRRAWKRIRARLPGPVTLVVVSGTYDPGSSLAKSTPVPCPNPGAENRLPPDRRPATMGTGDRPMDPAGRST